MNEWKLTRNMQGKTNATHCFACTSSNNHCERNQNIEKTYHVKKKTTNYEETRDWCEKKHIQSTKNKMALK